MVLLPEHVWVSTAELDAKVDRGAYTSWGPNLHME